MPSLLPELALLNDRVAGRGSRIAGRLFAGSKSLGPYRSSVLAGRVPDLLAPVALAMSEGTRAHYEVQPGGVDGFVPQLLPPEELALAGDRVRVWVDFALTQADPRAAFEASIERWLRGISRETNMVNAKAEGARWFRHASANACGFCRLMATRGAVYGSAKAAGEGNRFHDHCHCTVAVVRPSDTFIEAPYVAQWRKDYEAARDAGLTKPGEIANHMDNASTGRNGRAGKLRDSERPRGRADRSRPKEARRPQTAGGTGGGGKIPPTRFTPRGMDTPDEYPDAVNGPPVPFAPREAPMPSRADMTRVLRKHRHRSSVQGKTYFPRSWTDDDIEAAIELAIRAPGTPPIWLGEQIRFERVIDGVLVRVHIRTYPDGTVSFWSAYPPPMR